MVCERREGGRRGTAVPIVTNLYGLVTPSKTPLYRYDFRVEAVFSAKDGSEKHKELTKQIKDE